MKRVSLFLVLLLALASCDIFAPAHTYTFAEASQLYLDSYGSPEEESRYTSSDYSSVDWWWWTRGFEGTFVDTAYDNVSGWKVDSEYSFTPIP